MNKHLSKGLKISLFFAVGGIILFIVFKKQDAAFQADCAFKGIAASDCSLLSKIGNDISNANYYWILVTLVCFMITNLMRALRWQMMLNAIGYKPRLINLFGTVMINYLANLGIPRSGELIRAGLLSGYEDIPVEKVLGTIVTDRIFDVIMLLIFIALAILFGGNDFIQYLNENVNISQRLSGLFDNDSLMIGLFITGISTIFIIWKYRLKLYHSTVGRKLVSLFTGFSDGVQSVRNVSSIPLFIFYTIMIWVLYYLMTFLAFYSFAPTAGLGPLEGLVVFAFGSLGIVIPTPGGMGSYHYLIGEALSMYGISGADAFSFANILFFSIQIFVNVIFGALALIILPVINKD